MKYKFIFLILSCSKLDKDNIYYNSCNKYTFFKEKNKLYYDLFKDNIKFFFVEYNNDINQEIVEDGDFIYIKGNEEPIIPNLLLKKIIAINYIYSKYAYEYMIHTNLSSLWNIPVLFTLYNNIPKTRFFGGHFIFNSFITGTGIIVSNDLTPLLLKIREIKQTMNEDVAISRFMISNNTPIYHLENLKNYKLNYQILDENETDINSMHHKNNNLEINENTNTDDILYFRIRSSKNERDIFVAKNILKKLYNIVT